MLVLGCKDNKMIKKVLFIQNRTDIKRSNFFDHWENIHAPHMVKILNPIKYVLTFFEEDKEGGCCGMAELWFNSEEEYQEAMKRRESDFGKSDNWHDVAKAWPDLDRYEYTGKEITIIDNTNESPE